MRKIALLFCLGISQSLNTAVDQSTCMFVLKQGYFHPSSNMLRQQFKQSLSTGVYSVEGDIRYRCWRRLYAELNGSYFAHKGHAIVCNIPTPSCPATSAPCGECFKFKLPALGIGLKYFFELPCSPRIEPFIGIGMKAFFVRIHNNSAYVTRNEKINTVGGVFNVGLLCHFCTRGLLEIFVDYQHKKINPASTHTCNCPSVRYTLNISGVTAGIGIGLQW